jgi:hypothetical protein
MRTTKKAKKAAGGGRKPTGFEQAMHQRLRDLAGRPISPPMLLALERTAHQMREMLIADRGMMTLGPNQYAILPTQESGVGEGASDSVQTYPAMVSSVSSSSAETFASRMMREIVSGIAMLSQPKRPEDPPPPSLHDMINAAAFARTKGLTDLAAKMEGQIAVRMGQPGDPIASIPTAMKAFSILPPILPPLPGGKKDGKTNGKPKGAVPA